MCRTRRCEIIIPNVRPPDESWVDQWRAIVMRPEWRRLQGRSGPTGWRRPELRVRQRRDGMYAVVDGYGWGVEFASFDTMDCAELFITQGVFHT